MSLKSRKYVDCQMHQQYSIYFTLPFYIKIKSIYEALYIYIYIFKHVYIVEENNVAKMYKCINKYSVSYNPDCSI